MCRPSIALPSSGSYFCACPDGYTGDGKSCLQHVRAGELAGRREESNSTVHITVYCEPDGMVLVLGNETEHFEGRIFVRGQADNPHCAKTVSALSHATRPYIFKVEFQYCNVRLEDNVREGKNNKMLLTFAEYIHDDGNRTEASSVHYNTCRCLRSAMSISDRNEDG